MERQLAKSAPSRIGKKAAKPEPARRTSSKDFTPSPVAQHFLDRLKGKFPSRRELNRDLTSWIQNHGVAWRDLSDFLIGRAQTFARHDLLARYVEEKTETKHSPDEFKTTGFEKDYVRDFCKNSTTSSILQLYEGEYVCLRPGLEDVATGRNYVPSKNSDIHTLTLRFHSLHAPATFSYMTRSSDKTAVRGSWSGYAVSTHQQLHLLGLCDKREDTSFFLLAPHPDTEYSGAILVGMQSLTLMYAGDDEGSKRKRSTKHAVSRRIAAIRAQYAADPSYLAVALNWLNKGGRDKLPFSLNLEPPSSDKT